jgi:hypothetical protein
LRSKKLPPDAILEILKMVGELGWTHMGEETRLAGGAGRLHMPAFDEVQQRQAARVDPATWEGLWAGDGADALCLPLSDGIVDWIVISDGRAWTGAGRLGAVKIEGKATIGDARYRLVWAGRVGAAGELFQTIQGEGKTYYRMEGKALVSAVDEIYDELGAAGIPIAGWLELVDGALAMRGRAIALWAGGDLDGSLEILEAQTAHKRPRNDLFYWLARVRADTKDKIGARAAVKAFLDKAAKKAALRPAGEALRKKLR